MEACSCALFIEGEVHESFEVAPRRHAELVLGMVDARLRAAGLRLTGLDGLAFGRGPGAFTGVRIATGVVQGLAFGASLQVVGVSTLAVLAHGAMREYGHDRVLVAVDARMDEIYTGRFVRGGDDLLRGVEAERVCAPEAVTVPDEAGWAGVGSGFDAYGERLAAKLGASLGEVDARRLPRAADVALLALGPLMRGEGRPAEFALPVYLRDRVAVPKRQV